MQEAFDIADQYRNPVMVVMDGLIGQMMEPIEWHEVPKRNLPPKDWATTGRKDRDHNNIINSLYMDPEECDRHNDHLAEKYAAMEETRCAGLRPTAMMPKSSSLPTARPPESL